MMKLSALALSGLVLWACGGTEPAPATGGHGAAGGAGGQGGEAGQGGLGGDGEPWSCVGTESDDPQLSQAMGSLRSALLLNDIPGGAIAVVQDGKIVSLGVAGSKRDWICDPITPDTLFRVGYATQILTALGVLDAEEDGLLDVQAPITDVIPLGSGADDITLHHLLTNSGMYVWPTDDNALFVPTLCSGLAAAFADPADAQGYATPGTMHNAEQESNAELAGLALEIADGRPFHEAIAARVLGPLGMGGGFDTATITAGDHSWGNEPEETGLEGECRNRDPSFGYHGSIRDMARLAEYLTGGEGAVLEAARLEDLLSPQGVHFWSDAYSGYGFNIDDNILWHSSWAEGFSAWVVIFRESRLAVITLLNAAFSVDIAAAVTEEVAQLYDDTAMLFPEPIPPDPLSLPSLEGTYVDAIGFDGATQRMLEVSFDGTDLVGVFSTTPGGSQPVAFAGAGVADIFTYGTGPTTRYVRFWRDSMGGYAIQLAGDNGPPFYRIP